VHRRITLAIVTLLLLVTSASAQLPGGNVFFGYSYNRADFNGGGNINLNGWEGSLEGKIFPFVGVVADISGHYGAGESVHNAIFGPRLSFPVGKFTPFLHVLGGVGHISGAASDTSFSDAFGGGIDYKLFTALGWRFQVDGLQTRFFHQTQDDVRFSTGIVLRF